MKQVISISGHQTSKVIAICGAIISLLFWPLFLLSAIPLLLKQGFSAAAAAPMLIFILMPLFYLVLGYLFTRLGCFIYNKVAKKWGGIEFSLGDVGSVTETNTQKADKVV